MAEPRETPTGRMPQVTRRESILLKFLRAQPGRVGVLSFLIAILLGTVLLSLPIASSEGRWTHPADALFTATSGVCVTGLIVKDTGRYFSKFGQGVILCLIQAGGLGIMTLSAVAGLVIRKRLSLRSQAAVGHMMGLRHGQPLVPLLKYIVALTVTCELIGCGLLYWRWRGDFLTRGGAFYYSLFHAVSAFCNAGFSTFSDSLAHFRHDWKVLLTMAALIVIGGLGFPTVRNVNRWLLHRLRRSRSVVKLRVQTKLVLSMSAILIAAGAIIIFLIEYHRSMSDMALGERVLSSIFQSVTTRTAGFNTIRISTLAPASLLIMLTFMFVGASPGSTGGGIKTTTFGIMAASASAHLRGRERVEMFRHSIMAGTVHMVISVALLAVFCITLGTFGLLITEQAPFLDTLFEATSAFGTVGLSLGLTKDLTAAGKLIITVLMFTGRLGPVTLLISVAGVEEKVDYRYPRADVMVG